MLILLTIRCSVQLAKMWKATLFPMLIGIGLPQLSLSVMAFNVDAQSISGLFDMVLAVHHGLSDAFERRDIRSIDPIEI